MHEQSPNPFAQIPIDPLFKGDRFDTGRQGSMFGSAEETVDGDELVGLREEGDVVLVRVCAGAMSG
jgi:hypothetical protein